MARGADTASPDAGLHDRAWPERPAARRPPSSLFVGCAASSPLKPRRAPATRRLQATGQPAAEL